MSSKIPWGRDLKIMTPMTKYGCTQSTRDRDGHTSMLARMNARCKHFFFPTTQEVLIDTLVEYFSTRSITFLTKPCRQHLRDENPIECIFSSSSLLDLRIVVAYSILLNPQSTQPLPLSDSPMQPHAKMSPNYYARNLDFTH